MEISAKQIANYLKGTIEGNENILVNTFSKIEEAHAQSLCFIANKKYETYIYKSPAAIIVLSKDFKLQQPIQNTIIRVDDAYSAFGQLLKMYESLKKSHQKKGIDSLAFVADTAKVDESAMISAFSYISDNVVIGKNVCIYPNVYIGENVQIDDNSIINPMVSIYKECQIGKNVIIHSGTVIGSDGFGFAPQKDGSYDKIPQIGNVIIEDNVEIGANSVVDRSTMGSTIIKSGVKLDNLIQIAHNVEIGKNTVIAAQTGISGSTKLGSNCVIGGQVGIVGHISLAKGTKINAQSGVAKTITTEDTAISGSPAFDYKSEVKSQIVFRQLPDLLKRMNNLEAEIKKLQEKNS
ncbi:MAG TPA: UDP-3-O-(3-hydroxymyristoyl)glucosamine N-acyltransferase [Edaphocola sp.]|nr:UDP-3-O-(3-hydroxymyristoyl)glucosamine N-acyltransferase [Edaphocola sp.]